MTSPIEPRIALGSVYDPPALRYPRLLVMRHWPRGIPRGAVDQWDRDLGPADDLLEAYLRGDIDWAAFERGYREEMIARPGLLDWATRMATGTGVALLCDSPPERRCHRHVLADLIRERASNL